MWCNIVLRHLKTKTSKIISRHDDAPDIMVTLPYSSPIISRLHNTASTAARKLIRPFTWTSALQQAFSILTERTMYELNELCTQQRAQTHEYECGWLRPKSLTFWGSLKRRFYWSLIIIPGLNQIWFFKDGQNLAFIQEMWKMKLFYRWGLTYHHHQFK